MEYHFAARRSDSPKQAILLAAGAVVLVVIVGYWWFASPRYFSLEATGAPETVEPGFEAVISVRARSHARETLFADMQYSLVGFIFSRETGAMVASTGGPVLEPLKPSSSLTVSWRLQFPEEAGNYIVQLDVVGANGTTYLERGNRRQEIRVEVAP